MDIMKGMPLDIVLESRDVRRVEDVIIGDEKY